MTDCSALTEQELSDLIDAVDVWLLDTCEIFWVTGTDDVYGGHVRGHGSTPDLTVSCAIESGAAQDQERVLTGAVAEIQFFTVTLPAYTVVHVGDHLVVHSGPENLHLHVRAVKAPETLETEREVVAVETEPLTSPH